MAGIEIEGKTIEADGGDLTTYGNALGCVPGAMLEFLNWYVRLSPKEQRDFDRLVKPDNPCQRVVENEIRRQREHPLRLPLQRLKLGW